MNDKELQEYVEQRSAIFKDHYRNANDQYNEIWAKYGQAMPVCLEECSEIGKPLSADRDGPQGIYWVGKRPLLLFCGREHYGWYGETNWASGKQSICFSPLEFAFYTVSSMGSYWAIIKELIADVLQIDLGDWDAVLEKVAFTNACKCLSGSGTYQWHLHQNCLKHGYLKHEIQVVKAPVNVLFTKSYELSAVLFATGTEIMRDDEFSVREVAGQYIIECAHPGRQSHEWRAALKNLMIRYLTDTEG
jgi:hypothetical protein